MLTKKSQKRSREGDERSVILMGTLIRMGLVAFGIFADMIWSIKYTDYDYKVYLDASKHVLEGNSPYDRITYRYTPLLAYILLPGFFIHDVFGKLLFTMFDVVSGLLLSSILCKMNVSRQARKQALKLWAYFPMIAIISTRGNADSLIVMLSLLSLYFILNEHYVLGAISFGLAVHFKIYPVIYAVPFFLFVDSRSEGTPQSNFDWIKMKLFNMKRLIFTVLSAGTFFGLIALFYKMYGYKFLYETYLYHFERQDHRHNMSMFFNIIYLFYDSPHIKALGLVPLVVQWLLIFFIGMRFYKDLGVCMFYLSCIFVVFNKVCTAQYFLWFLALLPLAVCNNRLWNTSKATFVGGCLAWIITESAILYGANEVENKGNSAFMTIFVGNALFFIGNIFIMCVLLRNQEFKNAWTEVEKVEKEQKKKLKKF